MHDEDLNNFWLLNTACTTDEVQLYVQCSEYGIQTTCIEYMHMRSNTACNILKLILILSANILHTITF